MPAESFSRFVVCSDIHANLPALRAFFNKVDSEGYSRIFCCGDIVGYGAHPNECCDLIRGRGIPVVMGNHDRAAAAPGMVESFNDVARAAIVWTHEALTPENGEYLRGLPYVINEGDFTFVHASPHQPEEWNYILTLNAAKLNFGFFDRWICFIGHSHQPFVVELSRDGMRSQAEPQVMLSREKRYLINVGSIGQPRDRSPLMCYVTVDLEQNVLSFNREPYPVGETQQSIVDAGLPWELAERLQYGW